MSMHFEFEFDVPSVFEVLTEPRFLVDRCLELVEQEASCEVEERGKSTVISLTRKVEQDLPRFLAKMIDPVQTMQMTETWRPDGNGGYTGDYTFAMQGQPVTITAMKRLTEPASTKKCHIPWAWLSWFALSSM